MQLCQSALRREYVVALGWPIAEERQWYGGDTIARYRVTPGCWPWLMQVLTGELNMHGIVWGFRPANAPGMKPLTEVGIAKATTGRYLRHMWQRGRAILPIDGWFEVVGDTAWFVHLSCDSPIFVPVITNAIGQFPLPPGAGFVILVSSDTEGLVDPSRRRPIVLTPEDACRWMDPTTPGPDAERLVRAARCQASDFGWRQVDKTNLGNLDVSDRRIIAAIEM